MPEIRKEQVYVSMVLCDRRIEKRTEDGALHIVDLFNVGTREWFTSGSDTRAHFTVWMEINFLGARIGSHPIRLVITGMSGDCIHNYILSDIDVPGEFFRCSVAVDLKDVLLPVGVSFLNAVLDERVVNIAMLEVKPIPSTPPFLGG